MKAKLFNAILFPIAFVFAASGAITSDKSSISKIDDLVVTGYIHQLSPTFCEPVVVDCDVSGSAPCLYGGYDVMRKANPEMAWPCVLPLYRN